MKHPKKILITGRSLSIGGVEKALLALINTLDQNEYSIDLLLMFPEGEFLSAVKKHVRIIETPSFFKWITIPKGRILKCIFLLRSHPLFLFYFIKNLLWGFYSGKMAMARQQLWFDIYKYLPKLSGSYDIVYDFSGLLRRYVLYNVDAKEKYTWIHSDYRVFKLDEKIDRPLLDKFDKIYCVSETCKVIFDEIFPFLSHKSEVRHNIVDIEFIKTQIHGKGFDDGFQGVRLLDITRLDPNKGLDIAVRVCKRLKDRKVNFRWYILGNDPLGYRSELEKKIREEGVEECFILLGFTSNPYPYMNQADIIVHFSRFEGRSVAIDEALALKKIILLTNYPTAKDQIEHGINGYICEFEEKKLEEQLLALINTRES